MGQGVIKIPPLFHPDLSKSVAEQPEARASGGRRIESGFHLADGNTIIAVSLFPFKNKDHTNQKYVYTYYYLISQVRSINFCARINKNHSKLYVDKDNTLLSCFVILPLFIVDISCTNVHPFVLICFQLGS